MRPAGSSRSRRARTASSRSPGSRPATSGPSGSPFLDHGKLLAATCPRYGRVMLYRVTARTASNLVRDIELEGRPVAVGLDDRPPVSCWSPATTTPGTSSKAGGRPSTSRARRSVPKVLAGFYPDDLAITPDGRHALVLASGRGEGATDRPMPFAGDLRPRFASRKRLEARRSARVRPRTGDEPVPARPFESTGQRAAVSIQGSNGDCLGRPGRPRNPEAAWAASTWVAGLDARTPCASTGRGGLLAVDEAEGSLWYQA